MDRAQQQAQLDLFLTQGVHAPRSPTRVTNDVSDIAGAKPLLKEYVYTNKPHFYDPHDIKGSTSKELHPKSRRVGDTPAYQQLPIDGATPQPNGFRTNRVVNPLTPEYILPSFSTAPPVEPRFLRDSYNVSDIDGTRIRKREVAVPRNPLRVDDLPGAQPGWLPPHKRGLREHAPRDILDARDITNVDFKSSRVTNVLNPVYTINGMTNEDDPLSRPAPQHRTRNKPDNALKTSDIAGASCSDPAEAVVAGIVQAQRRHFRATNATSDIRGAQADTFAHSIRSERRVDPNWPSYRALDGASVDSSAVSVGRSIVFADAIHRHEQDAARSHKAQDAGQYVVSGVGNVGMVGHQPRQRRASLPMAKGMRDGKATPHGIGDGGSGRSTPADRKQAESRRADIELVRQLS